MKHIFPYRVPVLSISSTIFALGALLLWLPYLPIASQAQAAAPITPSGLHTQVSDPIVTGSGPTQTTQYNITGGTRPGGVTGTNLFHSFGDFNVPANNIANFLNDSGLATSNILARVTGTNGNNPTLSSIYGTIQTTGFLNANLFLMNPAGFLFGPNATVNVGGMMTFTTADYLKLTGIGQFNAIPDVAADTLLSAAPVAAFGFLGSNPNAIITFEGGQLTVADGTGVTLVGGDITLMPDSSGAASGITAHGRPILLTSVTGRGEVSVDTGIPAAGMALGTITLGQGTTLSTVGDLTYGDGSGGTVSIRGGQFVATGARILTSPARASVGQGGDVTITTTGNATIMNSTIDTNSQSTNGGGGAVTIAASDLTLEDSAVLTAVSGNRSAVPPTTGAGGTVALTGTDSVILTRAIINTRTRDSNGNGGAVTVISPIVTMEDSNIFTNAVGNGSTPISANGGSVTLGRAGTNSVSMTRSVINTESVETDGNSGSVAITGQNVMIGGNGGQQTIVTSTSSASGDPNAGNGGEIVITGTNVTFTDIAWLESVADSPGTFSRGGNILINGAQNILIDNGTVFTTTTVSEGSGGNIELVSPQVTIRGQSQLGSSTLAGGGAGAITITSTQNISLESGSILVTNADPGSQGSAGRIELNTPQLTIIGGSAVASQNFGAGPAGVITIQGVSGPGQSVLISDPGSGIFTDAGSGNEDGTIIIGGGTGGNISIHANSVMLQNGGILSAGTTGVGNAGNILVKANSVGITDSAQITSSSSIRQTPFFDGEVISPPTGNAGNVTIQGLASPAQSVLVDGSGSGIFTNTEGTGAGGNIFVNANSVTLQNVGALLAKTSGTETTASGGNINVVAGQSVTLTNGSTISASSTGVGDAGNIQINAGQNYTSTDSAVTTQAAQASGGNITVLATDRVNLTNSQLNASVQGSSTTVGGNITIDPQYVILQNSQILAQATQGQGGAISIAITNGGLFLPDANSTVSASSSSGVNGTVTIQSPNAPISGQIQPLGGTPLPATSLLNQHCASLAGGAFSSFTVAGRDSLPTEPGGWLSSPLAALSAGTGLAARGEGEGLSGLSGSSGWLGLSDLVRAGSAARQIDQTNQINETNPTVLSLRQIAPPGFLTQAFATDRSAGCQS